MEGEIDEDAVFIGDSEPWIVIGHQPDDQRTHIERINGFPVSPAHIPGQT